jgi:hypothetical protein
MSENHTAIKAELIEIGEVKLSKNWTNLYLKFRFDNGEERWLYYSEHVDKPHRLKQINDFVYPELYPIGSTMDVNYKIVQSPNKSTKLAIVNIANAHSSKLNN